MAKNRRLAVYMAEGEPLSQQAEVRICMASGCHIVDRGTYDGQRYCVLQPNRKNPMPDTNQIILNYPAIERIERV